MIIKNNDDLLKLVGIVRQAHESGKDVELDYAVKGEKRTLEQNKKSWAMYRDLSKQVPWNNELMTEKQWKALLTAGFACETMGEKEWLATWKPSVDGGHVVFTGESTRDMPKDKFSQYVEFVYAFAAEFDVRWSITSEEIFKSYGILVK